MLIRYLKDSCNHFDSWNKKNLYSNYSVLMELIADSGGERCFSIGFTMIESFIKCLLPKLCNVELLSWGGIK